MEIGGRTRVVGLFAHPIKHTGSPAMHNAAFDAVGLDWVYLPFEVRPERLEDAVKGLRALNIAGVNVTIPHKQKVMVYLDEISKEAKLIGAVNTIVVKSDKLIGKNTDGKGFTSSLKEDGGFDLKGKSIFILGAGGGGRAVGIQSALEGAKRILILDGVGEKAQDLAQAIKSNISDCEAEVVNSIKEGVKGVDLLVNATPVGMNLKDPLLINSEWLSQETFIFDLIYNPSETRLLKVAKERGCPTLNGMGMLVRQGAASFKLWTGREAPVKVMREALGKALK